MINIERVLKEAISEACAASFNHPIPADDIALQPTRKEFEGHYTFVTFPLTRYSKKKPEETAAMLGEYLVNNTDTVGTYNVVKGFLNLRISPSAWIAFFADAASRADFGQLPGKDQHLVIEYSSPNTNKPLHLGHLRNNFLGYSVSEIYKAAGYTVTRLNLVNDRGIHICKSMVAYQKYGNGETPDQAGIKGDHLIGRYYVKFDQEYKKEVENLVAEGMEKASAEKKAPLMLEAQDMLRSWEQGDPEVVDLWKKMNGWVYEGFDATYKRMGVAFDKIYHESETYILGKRMVEEGLEKGVFYRRADGSVWADLSEEGLDEKLLLRADGTSVYMTQDLGTADLKYEEFPFDRSVYVVGNEQDYHFDVLFKLLKKLGRPYAGGMHHLSYGMVDLPQGKMKSREGTVVDADDLMDEMAETARRHTEELGKIEGFSPEQALKLYEVLGLGALKFFLLKVDPKKRMLFNPEESIQFHGYTGPFVQYPHARIAAIMRKADDGGEQYRAIEPASLPEIPPAAEGALLLLSQYEGLVEEAALNYAPSTIAQFAYDLAKEYNRFYTEESIFGEKNAALRRFKIAFSDLVAKTIRHSMGLLGIEVPDRM
jgi:arginyl-tRNA synthetase